MANMSVKAGQLSAEGKFLYERLERAEAAAQARAAAFRGKTFHVDSIGAALSNAYEKLRNSTEYTEDHLLLQRAIRRFLRRGLLLAGGGMPSTRLAEELVIELTEAGYLKNDSVTEAQLNEIARLTDTFHMSYQGMARHRVPKKTAQEWFLDVLSVRLEWVFNDPSYMLEYTVFCHNHLIVKTNPVAGEWTVVTPDLANDDHVLVHIAVLMRLLKADAATMRAVLAVIYEVAPDSQAMIRYNRRFDQILKDGNHHKASLAAKKYGAPLRILYRTLFHNERYDASIINRPGELIPLIGQNARTSYKKAQQKLDQGVGKSIVFLIITKVLIGAAIEIPVDLRLYGGIAAVPLLINLLTPAGLILLQRLSISTPGPRNTAAISEYVEHMLYESNSIPAVGSRRSEDSANWPVFNMIYSFVSLFVFGAVVYLLKLWGFNPVQGLIFFIFVSTAIFLGYRLSFLMKDLEIIRPKHRLIGVVRDFVYTPFIFLGQWLSGKYARVNIVSNLLDLLIELPLKNALRLARQWASFMDEKKTTLT